MNQALNPPIDIYYDEQKVHVDQENVADATAQLNTDTQTASDDQGICAEDQRQVEDDTTYGYASLQGDEDAAQQACSTAQQAALTVQNDTQTLQGDEAALMGAQQRLAVAEGQ
jgi:hypothetical protein